MYYWDNIDSGGWGCPASMRTFEGTSFRVHCFRGSIRYPALSFSQNVSSASTTMVSTISPRLVPSRPPQFNSDLPLCATDSCHRSSLRRLNGHPSATLLIISIPGRPQSSFCPRSDQDMSYDANPNSSTVRNLCRTRSADRQRYSPSRRI